MWSDRERGFAMDYTDALRRFEAQLIDEEKSSVTIQKYKRDVCNFCRFASGRTVDKAGVLAYDCLTQYYCVKVRQARRRWQSTNLLYHRKRNRSPHLPPRSSTPAQSRLPMRWSKLPAQIVNLACFFILYIIDAMAHCPLLGRWAIKHCIQILVVLENSCYNRSNQN